MPTYISLVKYTEKALADMKHGPDRLAAAKQRARERGGEIKAFYLTMGQYDAVIISESPDDQTLVTGLLQGAAMGYVRTETLRAFTEDEYKKIIAALK